jgi:hypothetical protein
MNGRLATERSISERFMGPLSVVAPLVAAIFVLYLIGWDHFHSAKQTPAAWRCSPRSAFLVLGS